MDTAIRLTERQRECLHWVHRGYETKEIARELGLSPETVDMHVKNALQRLGLSSRKEAARSVFGEQGRPVPPPLVPPSPAMPDAPIVEDGGGLTAESRYDGRMAQTPLSGMPVPTDRFATNTLSPAQRLMWIGILTVGVAIGFGILVSGLEALSRLI
ncbi:hypothetical protein ASE75_13730 [Sphingomonas sp. Leaf17]|uniref:helix-turn-helix domain-containing protein n=1 Tax=Sphingomonas sp. Leaf17 TaxID=1735683 RepID=UPI0006F33310|nr:helix-turn-helix transcriptional regulator [Sphingomonas sp. Leaf17]KQM62685.1 hypothetical protein ASE75_13730 [Sphingomonas sp. Leaf17]